MKSSQFFKKLSIQHSHFQLITLTFPSTFLPFTSYHFSLRKSAKLCSRENSLGHVICRADWMPPCAFHGSSLLTCLLSSTSLTSFLLSVCPSGLSFLFHSLCQPTSKDDLKSSCDTWKSLLSQNTGHSKPAVASNRQANNKRKGRAAEIISVLLVTVAGMAHSKVSRIKDSDIQNICNQTEEFLQVF